MMPVVPFCLTVSLVDKQLWLILLFIHVVARTIRVSQLVVTIALFVK